MAISELTALIPPPLIPTETGDDDQIELIEEAIGLPLPDDVYDFANTYGTGLFTIEYPGGIVILNPFSTRYFHDVHQALELLHLWRREEPAWVPYPIYPEPGGLFPWGSQEDGSYLFWLTHGAPEEWPIIVWCKWNDPESPDERHHLPVTSYLAKALGGTLQSRICPPGMIVPDEGLIFEQLTLEDSQSLRHAHETIHSRDKLIEYLRDARGR